MTLRDMNAARIGMSSFRDEARKQRTLFGRQLGKGVAIPEVKTDNLELFEAIARLKDEDPRLRKKAVCVVASFCTIKSFERRNHLVPLLIEVMKHDPNNDVRSSAAERLGDIRDEKVIPELIEVVEHDMVQVKESAIFALGEFGRDAITAVPVLLTKLRLLRADAYGRTRYHIAIALGKIIGKSALPSAESAYWALENLAKNDIFEVQDAAKEALRRIRGE